MHVNRQAMQRQSHVSGLCRGVRGHAPENFLNNRCSEVHSEAFWGLSCGYIATLSSSPSTIRKYYVYHISCLQRWQEEIRVHVTWYFPRAKVTHF